MSKRTRLGVGDRPPTKPPTLVGATLLDTYVVEAELGSGAMGSVYRARHVRLPRHVALKVMHDHLVPEPALLARFYREAKAAASLQHPNVVSVLDVGETAEHKHVMVMELVDGTSLGELMDAGVAADRVVPIVLQILAGLEHAHDAGLVHRDLKPDNVLVDREGVARIADFGIATLLHPDEPLDRLTGTGVIVGTPLYMSPEQARAEPVDHRADLYALGIILYELLAGTSPFEGSAMEVAVAKMELDPPPIAVRAPHVKVDRVLEAFLGKLIARRPDDRFGSAREAKGVLELYAQDRLRAAAVLGVIDIERALSIVTL
ncbi:MAG TPA: serine/threonine-protein kinase [Kofleriaceae bacterium]|jgi:serine/threonine-protein kinase